MHQKHAWRAVLSVAADRVRSQVSALLLVGGVFALVVGAIGLIVGLGLLSQEQDVRQQASSPTGTVEISLRPPTNPTSINQTLPIIVDLNTKAMQVDGVQLAINLPKSFSNPTARISSALPLQIVFQQLEEGASANILKLIVINSQISQPFATNAFQSILQIDSTPTQGGTFTVGTDNSRSIVTRHNSDPPEDVLKPIASIPITITGGSQITATPSPTISSGGSPTPTPPCTTFTRPEQTSVSCLANQGLSISWTDTNPNSLHPAEEAGFKIYRIDNDPVYTQTGTPGNPPVATLPSHPGSGPMNYVYTDPAVKFGYIPGNFYRFLIYTWKEPLPGRPIGCWKQSAIGTTCSTTVYPTATPTTTPSVPPGIPSATPTPTSSPAFCPVGPVIVNRTAQWVDNYSQVKIDWELQSGVVNDFEIWNISNQPLDPQNPSAYYLSKLNTSVLPAATRTFTTTNVSSLPTRRFLIKAISKRNVLDQPVCSDEWALCVNPVITNRTVSLVSGHTFKFTWQPVQAPLSNYQLWLIDDSIGSQNYYVYKLADNIPPTATSQIVTVPAQYQKTTGYRFLLRAINYVENGSPSCYNQWALGYDPQPTVVPTCNALCRSDLECQSNYICYFGPNNIMDSGRCRLKTNPESLTCEPIVQNPAWLAFATKLQGLNKPKITVKAQIWLEPINSLDTSADIVQRQYVFDLEMTTSNDGLLYPSSALFLQGVPTNQKYLVYIKTNWSLRRKLGEILLVPGENKASLDWVKTPMLVGDFITTPQEQSNKINILDLSAMLRVYTQLSTPVTATNQQFDVNYDNRIDILDLSLVLSNYTKLEVVGD